MERIELLAELSIAGIGFSLVDNFGGHEISYLALKPSCVKWEQKQKNKFEEFSFDQSHKLELG